MALSMHLSVAIMAVPERMDYVHEMILPRLAAPCHVCVDTERRGLWWNAQRAWRSHDGSGYHLVLQDDLVLCRNFIAGVRCALAALDASGLQPAVSFYGSRASFTKAAKAGIRWVSVQDVRWGVALALPVGMVDEWLDWCEQHVRPDYPHDDYRLAMYLRASEQRAWCTVPSLVDHDGASRSVVGNSNRTRVARVFIGDEDPTCIDWSHGVTSPVRDGGRAEYEGLNA